MAAPGRCALSWHDLGQPCCLAFSSRTRSLRHSMKRSRTWSGTFQRSTLNPLLSSQQRSKICLHRLSSRPHAARTKKLLVQHEPVKPAVSTLVTLVRHFLAQVGRRGFDKVFKLLGVVGREC